jgi:phosphate transport system permease protein
MGPLSPPAEGGATVVRTTSEDRGSGPVTRRLGRLRRLGQVFHAGTAAVAAALLVFLGLLTYVLVENAWGSITRFGLGFLTSSSWDGVHNLFGAGPAIGGTLITSALALLLAVPVALGSAIFLSEIAPAWVRTPITYIVDLSAAIPSVVYGFWAYIVLVPLMRDTVEPALSQLTGGQGPFSAPEGFTGSDLFTASIVLAVMILPTIAALSREALRAVPRIQRESALSLGATRWEATRMAVLRPARPGIIAGVILGLGRAIGETIAVTMVIGNIFLLPGTLFSSGTTLPSWIINGFSEVLPGLQQDALVELGVILLAITIAVNVVARVILARFQDRDPDLPPRRRLRSLGRRPGATRLHPPPGTTPESTAAAWAARGAPSTRRRTLRRVVLWVVILLTALSTVIAVAPLASVVATAVHLGGSAVVQPGFYTGLTPIGCNPRPGFSCATGGIGPEIQGSLIMLGIASLLAIPIGLLAGIYISEYGRNRFGRTVSFVADVLTGVPTILLGLFVYVIFLSSYHDATHSALSGGIALGLIMIPITTRATEEALRTVSAGVREAALALGFPRHRVTLRVVLGCARGALITGILLAGSRAFGDAAALLLTASGSNFYFQGLTTETASLPWFIFQNFNSSYSNLQTDAWGAALVLLLIMLMISVGARLAVRSPADGAGAG